MDSFLIMIKDTLLNAPFCLNHRNVINKIPALKNYACFAIQAYRWFFRCGFSLYLMVMFIDTSSDDFGGLVNTLFSFVLAFYIFAIVFAQASIFIILNFLIGLVVGFRTKAVYLLALIVSVISVVIWWQCYRCDEYGCSLLRRDIGWTLSLFFIPLISATLYHLVFKIEETDWQPKYRRFFIIESCIIFIVPLSGVDNLDMLPFFVFFSMLTAGSRTLTFYCVYRSFCRAKQYLPLILIICAMVNASAIAGNIFNFEIFNIFYILGVILFSLFEILIVSVDDKKIRFINKRG
ncbi:hypothetical protein [Phocoenobacter skyensis]|uniref:Uncharacterized protein n=1 Tax=Phocoenobacter skyensis TaxID=97481 RepID=A0A1H7V2S5_9PAST|nr:hypothetical protein [Pasteurella skyensis]MDP8078476.1 hypothetical protein [Pasteurella skyensis]MDP8084432.1 hypothetical protein [Pasteurella skyensis]MDP8170418.1 hypothetical protein [Pasteurella skyensis]MDP8175047.1 hypothetical protein [Pasteurella skyensis]MDP8184763.1 hypothetical protein [Pasteurella skyensis]